MRKLSIFPDLSGKSVFITGGGSGIGATLTEGFIAQGAKVAFVQRSDASTFCDKMARAYGAKPLFFPADITNLNSLCDVIEQVANTQGKIDILVNNAADDSRHETENVSEDLWEKMLSINLKAYFFACKAAIPSMKKAQSGSIINVTSISYMMGNAGYPLYTTSNAGLMGMTRSLAREFGPAGIRFNAVAPGWVMTEKQLEKWVSPEALEDHIKRQCLKRPLVAADVLDTVLFLASDASQMITGQTLVVDGGVVATG